MLQRTISSSVILEGIALHSGQNSKIVLSPASAGEGINFNHNGKIIPAHVSSVTHTNRGTTIDTISVVEHLLAAITGLGIDNINISINSNEPPALDGSSSLFVNALKSAGIKDLSKKKKIISPKKEISVSDDKSSISILPFDHLYIETFIDYSPSFVGVQTASYDELTDSFEKEISPARTFGLISELDQLKKAGLALGASDQNAIGITNSWYSSPLRFPNELARHKILDIIGDITLTGCRVEGKIISKKAGHKLNIELARRLLDACS